MKKNFLKNFLFSAALFLGPSALYSQCTCDMGNFYAGLNAGVMLKGKDLNISTSLGEGSLYVSGLIDDGTDITWEEGVLGKGSDPGPTAEVFADYQTSLDSGRTLGGVLGFSFYNNCFLEAEASIKNSVNKVNFVNPSYIDTRGLYINSEVRAGFVNLGYEFFKSKSSTFSPFVSAGLGAATIKYYGELRMGFGEERDDTTGNYLQVSANSKENAYFEAKSTAQLAGNARLGFTVSRDNVTAAISYRYSKIFGDTETGLESYRKKEAYARYLWNETPEDDKYGVDWMNDDPEKFADADDVTTGYIASGRINKSSKDAFVLGDFISGDDDHSNHTVEVSIRVPFV